MALTVEGRRIGIERLRHIMRFQTAASNDQRKHPRRARISREQLSEDVAAYLAAGGRVDEVPHTQAAVKPRAR